MSESNSTLTQYRLKELLHYDPDTGIFVWIAKSHPRANRICIGDVAGSLHGEGYTQIGIDGTNYLAHRLAWLYVHGPIPYEMDVDHRDGNRSRNAIANLRIGSRKQNIQNQRRPHKRTTTGYLGVHLRKDTGRFAAYINESRKRRYLGNFDTAEEAHGAYLAAKRELHEFCTI